MMFLSLLWSLLFLPSVVLAAFGWTDNGSEYVIDSGADLVIKVTKCCGDISSLKFKGVEYNGWGGKNSHVESGLGASTVSIASYSNVIKVSVVHGTLRHWLFVRYGNNNVYLFTNKADNSISAMRYIVRIKGGLFSHASTESDFYDGGSSIIEAQDINVNSAGLTKSKHYQGSNYGRTIDYDYVGRKKSGVGLFMIRSNHEISSTGSTHVTLLRANTQHKASGGPFFRSLVRRADPTGEDLYDIYYYNMGHTDPMRTGLQGPSVLAFTSGEDPNSNLFARKADWSWFDDKGLNGWVPASGRGYASGVGLANMKSGKTYVVGLSNSVAQYWGTAGAGGAWSIAKVIPGTYTLTVYKDELEVATSSVTIKAGAGTAVNTITCVDPQDDATIWRIGEWDGTPKGFLNFEDTPLKLTYMHPSDSRISTWNAGNFIVGTHGANRFPGYMWKEVNSGYIIYFKLTADQLKSGHTVRIGLTEAYIGGRPAINVNSWASPLPAATTQASTRSLTVGTYRGNNVKLTYAVPQSAWVQSTSEWQILTINIISGSSGTKFLSPGVSFDALELLP
ncbi:Putative Galactose-binding-like domain superfamily, galactose mutarotase-like domain superfamily [Colletotrichum destructivum]|uniref:rhamnogalacturonan endolyase n=1 Tax=Colletotrichum destructivum TaxID=34406 RepID=A0AAX4IVF3_9PEZI|nr:Putative Galactose-binding-like domain superfamily, galactose mutarotase-like domain superfamily [Colletotrichum destructivum]